MNYKGQSLEDTTNAPIDNVMVRINVAYPSMAKGAKQIADYIIAQPDKIIGMSVTELSLATSSSEGSVINFCRKLGLSGFQHLKLSLAQETVQPVQFIHEDLDRDDDVNTACRKIFHSGIQALRDTISVLNPKYVASAVEILRNAKRIEVYGIGSSAPIAEDAHIRMLRIGLDVRVATDSHIQAISAACTDENVAVLTFSHSGATHETVTATKIAKSHGAKTIVITNFARSPIQQHADIVLYTMARETYFKTEAMTSRIAQLCVLDALIAALALSDYDRSIQNLRKASDTLSLKRF
jgi:DNA-binding MurR/RpiR family transcriptional regulator